MFTIIVDYGEIASISMTILQANEKKNEGKSTKKAIWQV